MSDEAPVRYTDPTTVLSPKGSVENLRVLRNTGEDGYSLASMLWDGRDALGIRWNGHKNSPIGNPQSRGIATWFILPNDVVAIIRGRFVGASRGINESNGEITRVRIRPLPRQIWKGAREEPKDDTWILSITDRAQGRMEIVNPRTEHFMAVDPSQVSSLARDTMNDRPNGPKHGILALNVQMIFEDGRLTLEPLQSLVDRIDQLAGELQKLGYSGSRDRVLMLVAAARTELSQPNGQLGVWEAELLDYATTAVDANFMRLAVASIEKAVVVNKLPPADYEYGFNYTRRDRSASKSP